MRKIRILGTGVPTMDIYPAHKEMFPGGNEYNIACNVALLGEEAGFLGVFARDLAAGYLQDTLKNLGVDMCACRREKGSSGYSLVELKEDGDRIFLMWNQEGAADKNPIQFTEEELLMTLMKYLQKKKLKKWHPIFTMDFFRAVT